MNSARIDRVRDLSIKILHLLLSVVSYSCVYSMCYAQVLSICRQSLTYEVDNNFSTLQWCESVTHSVETVLKPKSFDLFLG